MFPTRLSFVTYNLWMTERWPARAPALQSFLDLFAPDVLCVQELQSATQDYLDAALQDHERVHDPLPGWTTEGNDLIAANKYARPIAASVPQHYVLDMAPSDHWPVQAVYQIE